MDREKQTQTPRLWLLRKARSPFYQFNHSVYLFISLHKHLKDFKESDWICCRKQDKPHMHIHTDNRAHTHTRTFSQTYTDICLSLSLPQKKQRNHSTCTHEQLYPPLHSSSCWLKGLHQGQREKTVKGLKLRKRKESEGETSWGKSCISFSKSSYIQVHIVCAKSMQTWTGLN